MSDLFSLCAQNSSIVFICFPHCHSCTWVFWQESSKSVQLFCSTLFCLWNWWACPNQNNSPLHCRTVGLNLSQELCWCVPAKKQRSGSRMDATPPSEKMSGFTAFSTQLTPKTDGASEHCCAAPAETMATACMWQQEDCQANRRGEQI